MKRRVMYCALRLDAGNNKYRTLSKAAEKRLTIVWARFQWSPAQLSCLTNRANGLGMACTSLWWPRRSGM